MPHHLAVPPLGIYPTEMKTQVCTEIVIAVFFFLAVLFVIVQKWKQSKCPSTGEWINQLWHIICQYNRMNY